MAGKAKVLRWYRFLITYGQKTVTRWSSSALLAVQGLCDQHGWKWKCTEMHTSQSTLLAIECRGWLDRNDGKGYREPITAVIKED